jgi:hypothetical protein
MKNVFTAFCFFILADINAQITIASSDMPLANDTFRVSLTTAFGNPVNVTQTGANQTWDFTFLTASTQRLDTFVSVTATPYAYQFYFNNPILYPDHKANYALWQDPPPVFSNQFQVDDVYNYYKNSSTAFSHVGFGAKVNNVPVSQRFIPVDVIYEFPLAYQNTSTSTSSFDMQVPDYGYYGRTQVRNNIVDGWGTVKTPYGSFQALRVKSTLTIIDTVYSDSAATGFTFQRPKEYEFKWLAKSSGIPILQINASDAFGQPVPNTIVYKDSIRYFTALQEDFKQNVSVLVYPNPSIGEVSIKINGLNGQKADVLIFDALGKVVKQESKNVFGREMVSFSDFVAGSYLVIVVTSDYMFSEKFQVVK